MGANLRMPPMRHIRLLHSSMSNAKTTTTPPPSTHRNCIGGLYPRSNVERFAVAPQHVPWHCMLKDYAPPCFEAQHLRTAAYADAPKLDKPKWNAQDGGISRRSWHGQYQVDDDARPLNIVGRTGLCGRGRLGRWGPNHAGDAIVTRWKDPKRILEFLAIRRRDNGLWAIPGGMVDAGESVHDTIRREFLEEALNWKCLWSEERVKVMASGVSDLVESGTVIYRGYVDDPRNTDNAWMETVAENFHDGDGEATRAIRFVAGDDATEHAWLVADRSLVLHASHKDLIEATVALHGASW